MNIEHLKEEKRALLLRLYQINFLIKRGVKSITLKEISRNVERFTGVDVENKNNSKKDSVEARELFFRYGFECGYEGATLSRFAKCSRSAAICSVKRHKKVCKTSKPKQEYYNRFLKLMENAKKEKSRIQV